MEFRCQKCQHVGPPSSSEMLSDGVRLVCANCGHANEMRLGGPQNSPTEAEPAPVPAPPLAAAAATRAALQPKSKPEEPSFAEVAFQRFLPVPGDGLRCPKCVHLVAADDDHCERCGVQLRDAFAFAPGQAPWDQAPVGREDAWEQGWLLWRAVEDAWDEERFERFRHHVREHELYDFAGRRLRFFLVDHPDDPLATEFLREIAAHAQSRMMVASAQARASAEEFSGQTEKARGVLLWTALAFWLMILLVILTKYMC